MRRSAAALRKHRLRVVRRGAGSPLIVAVVGRRVLVLVLPLLFLACAQARAAPRRLADSGQAGGGGGESTEEEGGEEEEEGGEEEEPEWTITWCAYSTTDCSGKTKEDCSVRTDEDMNECIADYPDGTPHTLCWRWLAIAPSRSRRLICVLLRDRPERLLPSEVRRQNRRRLTGYRVESESESKATDGTI